MAYIEMKGVTRVYETGDVKIHALNGVDLQIEQGELAIIVGPSGAGKTTLLNLLGGMDMASSGSIRVDGREIVGLRGRELTRYRRLDIGFVFQFYNLVGNLTALENVELAGQICPNPIPAAEALEKVGLGERMQNFPAQLSGGEQQRVAIARALANNPSVIIADEPTGNLDPARSYDLMRLLERINELGTTILVVTHEKELVNRFSKRVLAIENGRIISDGMDGYYRYYENK